ncbi:MAG TPA: tRNA guanosine(34) transglycosylase Tgt, partial [Myxococcales bacterium]|nr:tRNA guanosine(34) transglycosylase Tgt [Myxococcales bacterium]
MAYRFTLEHVCAQSGARAGRVETTHGVIETPIFMPVATQAALKGGVQFRDVKSAGAQVVLANTYHLMLRPGSERIRDAGGLHEFMRWKGPILTDSGGFQVFSLSGMRKISDEGVVFQSHIDGSRFHLNAEEAVRLQENFGSDIAMAFDECPPAKADVNAIRTAMNRTTAWLDRAIAARRRSDEVALYGIVQGGVNKQLRREHVEAICSRDACEGFAIGGLSVGESVEELHDICGFTAELMPEDKARYLMGVGTPRDLLVCIGHGVDQFDCGMPSRNGRHGK